MKPITNETKARYFAGYLGCQFAYKGTNGHLNSFGDPIIDDPDCIGVLWGIDLESALPIKGREITNNEPLRLECNEQVSLLLRPIGSLTDTELMELIKITGEKPIEVIRKDNIVKRVMCEECYIEFDRGLEKAIYNEPKSLACYQYLQSIGIALPYLDYSVSDLVEAGVIKLIE